MLVGDGQRRVGGQAVLAAQHALGDLRDLDEVHRAGLGKGDSQFARRVAQQREAGAHDLPVFFRVAGRGQRANGGQRAFEAGNGGQLGDQFEEAGLFALAVGGKAQALIDRFAESAIAGEQQRGQSRVSRAGPLPNQSCRERARREARPVRRVPG